MAQLAYETRVVPLALAYARHLGLDVPALTRRAGLSGVEAAEGSRKLVTVAAESAAELMEALAEASGDPHVGVAMAVGVRRGTYGLAEFVVRSAGSLKSAFDNTVRFSALLAPSQTFRFEVDGDEARLEHFFTLRPGALGRHINEYTTVITALTLFQLAPGVGLTRAFFTSGPGPDPRRLTELLGEVPLDYHQGSNGYAIASAALDRPVASSDSELHEFLEEQARSALAARPRLDDVVERLRFALKEALAEGEPKIDLVAERLLLSGRTLQRRLGEVGTSFQQVLDEVRFDLARRYLRDERLDSSEVAYLLGYSELRAFDRAFRRWSGTTPRLWRGGHTAQLEDADST